MTLFEKLGAVFGIRPDERAADPAKQWHATKATRFIAIFEEYGNGKNIVRRELARTWIDAATQLTPFRCDNEGGCSASNATAIEFRMLCGGYPTHVGFGDETGEMLFYVPLETTVAFLWEGADVSFQPGHLTMSHVNNGMTPYAERKILDLYRELAGVPI